MRIAMIGPFGLEFRGTMKVRALPMAHQLAQRGHDVLVVMPPWRDPSRAPRRWIDHGVELEYVSVKPRVPVVRELATTGRLLRSVADWNPDVVHVFKPKAYSGLAGWCVWHEGSRRPRLVVDEDDWEGPGGWNDVSGYTSAQKALFAWQERWGLTHCDAVTVASRELELRVRDLGVDAGQITYVPNGSIQREQGDGAGVRTRFGLDGRRVILLYTRFFEFDPARVVRMLSCLVRLLPDANLLVVGEALDPADDQRFDALIRDKGLQDHVRRTGWVDAKMLPDLYAAADAAWFPFDDTLINRTKCSVKLVDLLTAGVPTIADAVGQNKEYIKDRETGMLVTACDEESMVNATLKVLNDKALASTMGRMASRDMRERFDWVKLTEKVLRAYSG